MRRRQVLRAALSLLGGAAVTVAVAWGCVLARLQYWLDWGSEVRLAWPFEPPARWPEPTATIAVGAFGCRAVFTRGKFEENSFAMMEARAGWPLRGLRWTWTKESSRLTPPPRGDRRGVIALPYPSREPHFAPEGEEAWLPCLPLPAGFAANTLFYAALLWLPLAGARRARRANRRCRGRCRACGYDLAATTVATCPECGTPRQA